MSGQDDDLLARLNALKPSSVTLDTNPPIDIEISRPQTIDDKLSDRLKRLRHGEQSSDVATSGSTQLISTQGRRIESSSLQDGHDLHEWQNDGNEQSLDDLLAELETNEQARLNPNDEGDVGKLMQEVRNALSNQQDDAIDSEKAEHVSSHVDMEAEDHNDIDEAAVDREADEYVQRVLAELSSESSLPVDEPEQESALSSTPAAPVDPPSYEDSQLESRFARLGLDLPATPTAKPAPKSKKSAKPKSNLPTYTDEDIDSWCCICNEDGELRCLGCDGDIYCQKCWTEGHGTGPGQERGHKAMQYTKKGGSIASAD